MKKLIWIIVGVIVVLAILFFVFNGQKTETNNSGKEAQKIQQHEGTVTLESYSDIQTSDDVFKNIDETVNFID